MSDHSMRHHIGDLPLVIVHNYLESFRPFLSRTGDESILLDRRFNGDQALYWLGDHKLIITSAPITDAQVLSERWGYTNTQTLSPKNMTASISEDILREKPLVDAIVAYAGAGRRIALVPYAATQEFFHLAETLRSNYGLDVHLPECPAPGRLWIKGYLDSKVGFRTMFSQWAQNSPGHKYPHGFICDNLADVAKMAHWFREEGKGCVIKASQGGSGVGNLFLPLDEIPENVEAIYHHLHHNIYLTEDLYVVEELIDSPSQESPSAEFYCPPLGTSPPVLTYISDQHFEASGRFAGVLIGKEIEEHPWYPAYVETVNTIARQIQQMGYVGSFDIDSIVNNNDDVYMVEINTRRTGGTYAHEFLTYKFGPDYSDRFATLAQNKMIAGNFSSLQELENIIGDLLFPINGEEKGVIVLLTSTLQTKGSFGFLILGETLQETKEIRAKMTVRLEAKKTKTFEN